MRKVFQIDNLYSNRKMIKLRAMDIFRINTKEVNQCPQWALTLHFRVNKSKFKLKLNKIS